MEEVEVRNVVDLTNFAYVKDGVLYVNAPIQLFMVESSSDLTGLTQAKPGSFAFVAGLGSVWHMDADGSWQSVE